MMFGITSSASKISCFLNNNYYNIPKMPIDLDAKAQYTSWPGGKQWPGSIPNAV